MVITLPGGYVDRQGALHGEVELSPLTGRDELFLRGVGGGMPSVQVVTKLLARCVTRLGSMREVNEDVARGLLVGDREYLVMRLFEESCGGILNALLRCPGGDCGALMDVALSLSDITSDQGPIAARHFHLRPQSAPERDITFRLPNGGDQEALADIGDDEGVTVLLARCTGLDLAEIDTLPAAAREEVEAEMEKRAPLADIEVEATCPECERVFSGRVSWSTLCLGIMANQAADIERDVHVLAWHYHWGESDVLSMPRTKRRRYIGLIEEELGRANGA